MRFGHPIGMGIEGHTEETAPPNRLDAAEVAVARARARLEWFLGLIPKRALSPMADREIVGDSLERLHQAALRGALGGYAAWIVVITAFFVLVDCAGYVVRQLRGKKTR